MTISYIGGGAANASGTAVASVAPGVHSSAATNDISFLTTVQKPYNSTITTPSGWTKIGEFASGSVASAADAGSAKAALFYKISATASSTVAITTSGADSLHAHIFTYRSTLGGNWNLDEWATGVGSVSTLAFRATASTGLDLANGNRIISFHGLNSDNGTRNGISPAMTGNGSATIDTTAARLSTGSNTGNDVAIYYRDVAITAGAQTSATLTSGFDYAATPGTTIESASFYLILRDNVNTVTADFSGSGTLTLASVPVVAAAPGFSGSGTLTVDAQKVATSVAVDATFSGSGSLSTAAVPVIAAAPGFSGSGTLTSTQTPAVAAAPGFSGGGALSLSVQPVVAVDVSFSGSGALSAASVPVVPSAPGFTGSGTLTAAIAPVIGAAPGFSGSGTLSISPSPIFTAAASFSGSGTMSAAVSSVVAVPVDFSGSGSLAAGSVPAVAAAPNFSGSGTLSAASVRVGVVAPGFTGSGTLVVDISSAGQVFPNFSGSGSFTLAVTRVASAAVGFSGSGTLVVASVPVTTAAPAFSGSGSLSLDVLRSVAVDVGYSGSGTLAISATQSTAVAPGLSGSGSLTVEVLQVIVTAGGFSGSGLLTTVAVQQVPVAPGFSGDGQLDVQISQTVSLSVDFSGEGTLEFGTELITSAGALFSGDGTLTVIARQPDITDRVAVGLGNVSWTTVLERWRVEIQATSTEQIPVYFTAWGGVNGDPAVVFDTQEVRIGLAPIRTKYRKPVVTLAQLHPAEWVGPAGSFRWARLMVGPGAAVEYPRGVYEVYSWVEGAPGHESPIRRTPGGNVVIA